MSADSSSPVAQTGKCVFCGAATTNAARSTSVFRRGEPGPDGMIPLIPRPSVWLCDYDMHRYNRHEVQLGWCETCIGWGGEFNPSPCGEPYLPLG